MTAIATRPVASAAIITRMADTMREISFAGQTVDRTALRQRGFTGQQIDNFWQAACDRANEMAVRQVSASRTSASTAAALPLL